MWDSVQQKYSSQIDFVRLNGDDPNNNALRTKYAIRGYPSLIWTDDTQNPLKVTHGFRTVEEFEQQIKSFIGE